MNQVAPSFIHRQADVLDRNNERIARMAQVVERFASRLCFRQVRVRAVPQGMAPAWSSANTITFNASDIGNLLDPRVVIATRGLALHEVSHILYTPRSGSDISQWVVQQGIFRAFNALEDQRIETLMVGRFGDSVVDWFTFMVAQHLLANPEAVSHSFPLIRGRKYLPVEVRKAVKESFVDQSIVPELCDIIDQYRLLAFPADTETAKPLIARYHELVKNMTQEPPKGGEGGEGEGGEPDPNGQQNGNGWTKIPDPHGHDKRPPSEHESGTSKAESGAKQQRDAKNAEARDEQDEDEFEWSEPQPDEADGDASDGQPSDSDADSDADGADEQGTDGDTTDGDSDDADGDDADGEGDGEADTESDADGQGESATNNQPSSQPASDAGTEQGNNASDALQDALNDVLDRLAEQVDSAIKQYSGEAELEGEKVAKPAKASARTESVSDGARKASKAFSIELERLRSDNDPAWEHRTSGGRINVKRYLNGEDITEVFDRWTEGRDDATDIEAVIMLDTSGSMRGQEVPAFESMWAIKRALDKVDASTTVLTFSDRSSLLYEADEQASTNMKYEFRGGGTQPLQGIRYAKDVLARSDRKVKVLFTITDGVWNDTEACDEAIAKLRSANVLTALAFIGGARDVSADEVASVSHGSEITAVIRSTADLFSLGRQLVRVAVNRNLATA